MTDEGGQALLQNPDLAKLDRLDLHYHFMGEDVCAKLQALEIEVDVSDVQEGDEDDGEVYRYVAVSE